MVISTAGFQGSPTPLPVRINAIFIHSLFIFVQKDTEHTKAGKKGKKKKIFIKETQCYGLSCERLRKDQVSISGKKWRSHRVCSLSQSDDVINTSVSDS